MIGLPRIKTILMTDDKKIKGLAGHNEERVQRKKKKDIDDNLNL